MGKGLVMEEKGKVRCRRGEGASDVGRAGGRRDVTLWGGNW